MQYYLPNPLSVSTIVENMVPLKLPINSSVDLEWSSSVSLSLMFYASPLDLCKVISSSLWHVLGFVHY